MSDEFDGPPQRSNGSATGNERRTSVDKFPLGPIEDRLARLEVGQAAISSALNLMLDTLQVQTNLLRELANYARDEPGPSPVLKVLSELTEVVSQMDVSISAMGDRFGVLCETIATAFDLALDDRAEPARQGGVS
jgi:hypothetical protein